MRNSDMRGFESMYLELWTACAKVGDQYLVEIAPLLELSRPDRLMCSSAWRHNGVQRACLTVGPATCSANVAAGQ